MADRRLVGTIQGTNTQKEIVVDEEGRLVTSPVVTPPAEPVKATDRYGFQAVSEDATYKYFWFEAGDLDYYILRKHKANKVMTYTAGEGGYTSVYQNSTSGPSGTPTWGSYGATF